MNQIFFFVTITKREYGEEYISFFQRHQVSAVFSSLCNGTAQQKTLDYLGIEKTQKIMLSAVVTDELAIKLMKGLRKELYIDSPGNGIALTIPVSSVGGASGMKYLTEGQSMEREEGRELKERTENQYSLIVVIAEKDNSEVVMEAARSAGAGGGTLVHAKGTGTEFTSKFFGVAVAAEKEMIYIVSKKSEKDGIMKAIMEQAGMHTDAHAAVFTLPVDSVIGLRSVEE